jgi:hypothetical protein
MRKKYPYKSLLDTLQQLKRQSKEGVNFMAKNIPGYIDNPRDLFYYLKTLVTYKSDPQKIELIHSPKSMLTDNFHGVSGAGDCDDFSMLAISALKAIGIPEGKINIVLTGNKPTTAKHIYLNVDGTPFDLTNSLYGYQRPYKFQQIINLKRL